MKRVRALLVGLGQIGFGYDADLPFLWDHPRSSARTLTHARALACHPGYELIGGIDPKSAAREDFSRIYCCPSFDSLQDWQAAWRGPDPELVVVAVAPQLQPILVDALLSMIAPRLLLLEKPVATNMEQAKALEQRCNEQPNLEVAINYTRRYLPAVRNWQARINTGELGRLLYGQITYGKGILSNGSHFVNLAEALLGPLDPGKIIEQGKFCMGFDHEASLELLAREHCNATVQVRSIGSSGLRAGEVDLWFEFGRFCWPNHGRSLAFWPRLDPVQGDSHAPLAADPDLLCTGIDHYQLEVAEALHQFLKDPITYPLGCDLKDGVRTLKSLSLA